MGTSGSNHARIRTVGVVLLVVLSGSVVGVGVGAPSTLVHVDDVAADTNGGDRDGGMGDTVAGPVAARVTSGEPEADVGSTDGIEIQHDPSSAGAFGDEDTSAEELRLATTEPGEAFAFGGDLGRVLVIRDVGTDRTIVLDPESPTVSVTGAELEFYAPEGDVSSSESIDVELNNGSTVSIETTVSGDMSLFEPDPSPFGRYRIELRGGYQPGESVGNTELIDATEPRLIGIGYGGTLAQNSTTGTILVSVPRHEDVDESWHIVYWVWNETSDHLITKEVMNRAEEDRLTVEIDGSTLADGSYFHGFTIRQEEGGQLDSRVLSILAGNKLAVGPRSSDVTPGDVTGDGNPAQDPDDDGRYEDVNGDGDVTPGDATVLFNAVFESNPVVTENVGAFDFNGDGSVTPGDATVLFNSIF